MKRFVAICLLSIMWGFSGIAWATDASLSMSSDQGLITVIGNGSFSSYTYCNSGEPPYCWTVDSGSLRVSRNTTQLCYESGHGSASCTYEINTATLPNGTHLFTATAADYAGVVDTDLTTIDIDNTPMLTVTSITHNQVLEGNFDIAGTVQFKDNPQGNEGTLYWYIDGTRWYSKKYEGTSISFSYNQDTPESTPDLNAATMTEGEHTIMVRAIAANYSASEVSFTVTVENEPQLAVTTPSPNEALEGKFDIAGTVQFKDNPQGNEGTIYWYIDGTRWFYKKYEGTSISFSYNQDTPESTPDLNAATMTDGEHTIKVRTVAANYEASEVSFTVTVENKPQVVVTTPSPSPNEALEGKFDIAGTVQFKDNPQGDEGAIYWYIDGTRWFYKKYEGTSISFSYNQDTSEGTPDLNAANFNPGVHKIVVIAYAVNYTSSSVTSYFIVGCSDPNYAPDYDKDGVIDCNDACPTVKGNAEDGCYYAKFDLGRDDKDPETDCQEEKVSEKGNPTSIYTGNKMDSEQDLGFNSPFFGGFNFRRFYNSQSEEMSPIGYGWTHNYNITLQMEPGTKPDTTHLVITDETGFGRYFSLDLITGTITPLFEERTSLVDQSDTYTWQRQDGTTYTFDAASYQLLHIEDRLGNRRTITYDVTDPQLIDTVSDEASGRSLEFSYTNGLLTTIRLISNGVDSSIQVTYDHDENGNLTAATFDDGSGFVYEYNDIDNDPEVVPFINNLTRKTNAAGHLLARWAYDDQDRCDFNKTGDGRSVTMDYDTTAGAVTVTDAYGVYRTYLLTTIKGRKRIVEVTGDSGCVSCIDEPVRWGYDVHLNVTAKEYANGRIDQFTGFDSQGNPGTITRAVGTVDEKVISFTWHPVLNQPLARTEQSVMGSGNKVTTWDYDDDGNDTANENPTFLVSRMVVNGSTLNGSGAIVPVESVTRFSYNIRGQLLSIDGPLAGSADTTSYSYDPTTSDLVSLTRPVSGTTALSNHDAAGRPERVTDSNGNSIDITYDGLGRLTAITLLWDSTVTGYTYNTAGDLDTVTLPNGATFAYEYEPVYGRLINITDALDNTVEHGYDAQGNVTETGYHLPAGNRTFWQRFDYQYPGRPGKLWKQINPDDTFFEYAYDAVGNLNQVTDPAGKITAYSHDLLNRPVSTVQPGTITTDYVYDGQGNLVLVTNPESHTTEYVFDDLGRTVNLVSPDAGTTVYTFNAAGNPVSKIDANNITSTYTYDAEYRLTGIHYPDPAQDVTYTYDQGVNGKGRLTGMTDQIGVYAYAYDPDGNRVQEERTIEGRIYTTAYTYDATGTLTGITYPNGRRVTYELDATGRVTRVTTTFDGTTSVVAENIAFLPFGPLTGYDSGSGIHVTNAFDESYRPTGITAGTAMDLDYTLDPVGNITAITDTLDPALTQSFAYDDLYRLTSAIGVYGTIGYAYDKIDNRLTKTENSQTDIYQYITGTSRLQNITGANPQSFTFDNAGNMTAAGGISYVYNQNNRLIQVNNTAGTLGDYVTSANGQRIKTITANGTTIFHYDLAGNLIGESTIAGDFIAAYIYLGSLRLAAVAATPVDEIAVTVTTSEGRTLSGINVYAFTQSGAYTGVSAVTDESGKATFNPEDLAGGDYKFRADYLTDQFWSPVISLPGDISTEIVIAEETVTVQVTQADVPKAGVNVYLFNETGSYLGIVGTTDENGNATFILPADQGYRFRADVLGSQFMSEVLTVTTGGANGFTVATGGGTLTVSLKKGDETPLSGINMYLFAASGSYLGLNGQTDAAGEVSCPVPSGTYKVRADYMGYQFWTDEISVSEDSSSGLVIPHQDVTIIVNRDLNGDIQIQAGIPVYLFTAAGSYLGVNTSTNEQGQVIFNVPAQDYKVRADCMTRQYWSEVFNHTDKTITIAEGTAIVTITGLGLPLTGVNVYAFNDTGAYLGLNDETESQGQVEFRLPEGDYNFRADYMSSQYFSGNTTVIAHTDNPVGISTGGGNLMLTVEKAPGDPMAGFTCYLFSADGAYLGQNQVTSGDGTVDFNLADGDYLIRVDYLGYQYWTDEFDIPATSATSLAIDHQDVTVTITGDNNGDVLTKADVPVYLFTPTGAYMGLTATTDAAGQAVFNLPAKEYTIRADYLGRRYWTDSFTATDAAITIPEGIAAVTVTQGSDLLENVNVYVFSTMGTYLGISAATDADGQVAFRLPAGTYKFRADHMNSQFWATAVVDGDVNNAIALSTGGGSFALTVQKESGEVLTDIPVYVFSTTGTYLGITASTDATGHVSFDLADGDYRFRADYLGYPFWTLDYTVPNAQSDVLAIVHQDVTVTVNEKYGLDITALENIPVYLLTSGGAYMGQSAMTDADGKVTLSLPPADYQVRVYHLASQTWSQVFNQTDVTVDIDHGQSTVHVFTTGFDLYDVPVYLFTQAGAYLGRVEQTDSAGLASFLVPAGAYKFRVDYDGSQIWSEDINILADEETVIVMDLDVLLSDLTRDSNPIRFDGAPPEYEPEKLMVATLGSLIGILPQLLEGHTTVDRLYLYINDHLGTPKIITDDTGTVVWKADYLPFGEVDITVNTIESNLRFAGQYFDGETGLHYNYHRYYDPVTGRYLTPDPIGLAGGINLYAYVQNNPVNLIDPWGLAWITVNANASGDSGSSFGHGWVIITNDNGTQEAIGHYPSGITNIDMNRTPSAYYTFEVDQKLADEARKAAMSEDLYDIFGRNCVDLVERSLDAAEINYPSFNELGISRPDKLNNWILNLESGPIVP